MTPGEYIKQLRLRNKLSQEELAEKLNFDRSTITKYENNNNQMKYETIKLFAEFFDEPIINIITGDSKAHKKYTNNDEDSFLIDYYNYKVEYEKNKFKNKILKFLILPIVIIITLTLIIYILFTKYSSIKTYSLFSINNDTYLQATIIDTLEDVYLYINSEVNNEKIISLTLYYKEKDNKYFIFQDIGDNIRHTIKTDNYNTQDYIDFTKKEYIFNNLYVLIKTNTNTTYDYKLNISDINKNNNMILMYKKLKRYEPLDDRINRNIYNLNTSVVYKNIKYNVKTNNDVITITNDDTDITIKDKMYIGKYNNQNITIYEHNMNEDEKIIYNEINEIVDLAIK